MLWWDGINLYICSTNTNNSMVCTKKKYPNKYQAKKHGIKLSEKFGKKYTAYHCKICKKAHLTTSRE